MRHVRNALLVCFTLLLVAAGAVMPYAAASFQDARLAVREVRPFDSFSLTLKQEADLSQLLRVIDSGSYYMHEAAKADNAVLTEGMALEAAENVLLKLVDYELLSKELWGALSDPRVMAQQVVPVSFFDAEDMGNAAALGEEFSDEYSEAGDVIPTWTINWSTPDYFYIWLDDASGKAIHISIKFRQEQAFDDIYGLAEKWQQFLTDYYGVEVALSDAEWYDNCISFLMAFRLGEEGEEFHLTLDLYTDGYVSLHPWN